MMILRRTVFFFTLFMFTPLSVSAAGLDDYYLTRFKALYGNQANAALAAPALPDGALEERCLTPLYHGLKADWKQLSSETQQTLAKYLAKPTLSGAEAAPFTSLQGHFKIHYTMSGADAPPPADGNKNGTPDWVETVASVFEEVYGIETGQMGYNPAPTLSSLPYDVYLQELSGQSVFGFTDSDTAVTAGSNSYTSFIIIDNDFANDIYKPYTGKTGLQATAAHEYHHAIQYGYNYYFDIWYAEATSTWIEDEVYDSINQLYAYPAAYMKFSTLSLDTSVSTFTGGGYGRWIFNRYLAERYGLPVIKYIWERLAVTPSPAGGNIPMLPDFFDRVLQSKGGSLGSDFLSFTKRIYVRDWTTHVNEIDKIPAIVPVHSYSSYPATSNTVTLPPLPHYAFAYYQFSPLAASAPRDLVITLSKDNGITATAFKKTQGGNITEYQFVPSAGTITIAGFNAADISEASLLISNNSSQDNQTASFTTNDTPPPQSSSGGGGGGGGGCFIATAAYGSYLHPKVVILRDFRDKCLLTNAPGRAFVALYYSLSPPLADLLSRHEMLRSICRIFLTPIVIAVQYLRVTAWLLLSLFFLLICLFLTNVLRRKCLTREGT